MWSRDLTQTGSRLILLLGQLIVLIACISYINYIYTSNINPDKRVKEVFREVNCFLVSKKLSTHGHLIHSYRADFLISYHVNEVQYNRWVSGNGLDASFTNSEGDQEDILSQYQVGGNYTCYYDPDNPQLAILVLRHNWLSTFPLIVPSVVTIIIFYYFFKNALSLAYMMRTRRKNPR
jgi:hypothetical protein